ncbi:HAT C-terminal dimerization domain [Trinorchestia longiramus]|nr:HAT C-terminal dimerization domain [Trinorchestia longiramus]
MSLGLVKEEPEESSSVDFCSTAGNDSSLALDSLLFLTNKREEEEFPSYAPAAHATRDCGVETFLSSERDFDDREEKMSAGASCVVPKSASANNQEGVDLSQPWTAESRFPRVPAALPNLSYTEDEVRALVQMGRYRLVKLNYKCRIWQYFERVFNEFGQDTTFVVCLSCRNLLRHKLTSSSALLVAHVLHCSGHRLTCDSPESPGSRSSESVSPQLAREELPNQQSQLLFSPQLLNADHFALRQQLLWKSQNTFLQCNSSNVPSLPSLSPFEAHDTSKNSHSNFSSFGASLPASTSLSPRLQFTRHDATSGIASPSLISRRSRRSRHRDISRHQRPSDSRNPNTNSGSANGVLSENTSQKSTNNTSQSSLAQKAVLDAAVAFCCLDGRWFDDISGLGMRELAQAFINIGAQFGTLPAEMLLPSAFLIRNRATEMAGLKRRHVASSLCETIRSNGGCLAIAGVENHDRWLRCMLYALSGKLRQGVVLGEWPCDGPSNLRRRLSDCLNLLGLLPLKDDLIVTVDSSVLAYQERTHPPVTSKCTLQTSELETSSVTSLSQPSSVVPERRNPAMTEVVPCGVGIIQDAINKILNHPRLCARYRRTMRANFCLLRAVEAAAPPQLVTSLRKALRPERNSFSLAQVKFTLQKKKEIEEILSRSPECYMHDIFTPEKDSNLSFKGKSKMNINYAFFDSTFENKRKENPVISSKAPPFISQVMEVVIKKDDNNSSELLIDDSVLVQVTDYFEPFDAALSDISNSNENGPNLGKLLPWIKTLRQYAADPVESVLKDLGDSGFRDNTDETACEYCLSITHSDGFKNCSYNSDSEVHETISSIKEDNLEGIDGLTNISFRQNRCLSLHEVGHEIVTSCLVPHPAHYVATFLTPHFKSLAMLDEHERHKTLKWVKLLATEDRGIGTQFWMCASNGSSNSVKFEVDSRTPDQNLKFSSSPEVDRNHTQSLNAKENLNTSKFQGSNASINKCTARNENQNDYSCRNINNSPSKNEKKLGGSHKNPTLKSLLEDDTSQLYQSEPNRSTHRARGHPTLVSLLESSSADATHSSAANNLPFKRSFQDSTALMNSLSDCDRPNKTQKTMHAPERVGLDIVTEDSTNTTSKNAIDNTTVQRSDESKGKPQNGSVAGSCNASKTNVGNACSSARGWTAKSRFTSIAHFMQSNASDSGADDSPVDIELSRYQSLPFPPSSASSDDWWREKSSQMPTLAAVARRVLAVPVAILASDQCNNSRWLAHLSGPYDGSPDDREQWLGLTSGAKAPVCPNEADVESLNNLMFLAADW